MLVYMIYNYQLWVNIYWPNVHYR